MKNKLWAMLALFLFSAPAFALQADSVTFKNQLGIIASPSLQYLFSMNRTLPVGIIYKRQVKPDQAWRFSVSGRLENNTNPSGPYGVGYNFITMKQSFYYVEAMFGHEWQKELSRRWTFYYGADAGVGFSKSNIEYDISNFKPNGIYNFGYGDISTKTYMLQPMAGIKFNLHSRLYLATETSISLNHSRSTHHSYEVTISESQEQPAIKDYG